MWRPLDKSVFFAQALKVLYLEGDGMNCKLDNEEVLRETASMSFLIFAPALNRD